MDPWKDLSYLNIRQMRERQNKAPLDNYYQRWDDSAQEKDKGRTMPLAQPSTQGRPRYCQENRVRAHVEGGLAVFHRSPMQAYDVVLNLENYKTVSRARQLASDSLKWPTLIG